MLHLTPEPDLSLIVCFVNHYLFACQHHKSCFIQNLLVEAADFFRPTRREKGVGEYCIKNCAGNTGPI